MNDEDSAPEVRRAPTPPMPVPLTPAQAAQSAAERKNLVKVLATDDGRAVIWRILEFCSPYAANDKTTDYLRGVQEGERRIGLRIITLIESADTLGYAKLIEDDAERQAHIEKIETAIRLGEQQRMAERESKVGYWERLRRRILPSR